MSGTGIIKLAGGAEAIDRVTCSLVSDSDKSRSGAISATEDALRASFASRPEAELADWVSSHLAIAIELASDAGWARPIEARRARAMMLLAIRLFHGTRALMAVLSVGYAGEARTIARLILEVYARFLEIVRDDSDETARHWLERSPRTSITAAIERVGSDPAVAREVYRGLCQHGHADVGGIEQLFLQSDEASNADVSWGPHDRSGEIRRLLGFSSRIAAEVAVLLAADAAVEVPDARALMLVAQDEKLGE